MSYLDRYFNENQDWIYRDHSCEFMINRILLVFELELTRFGLVCFDPEDDGRSVAVFENNLDYCGDLLGVFNYCKTPEDICQRISTVADVTQRGLSNLADWNQPIPTAKDIVAVIQLVSNRTGVPLVAPFTSLYTSYI